MFLKYHILHRDISIISVVYNSESSVRGGSCGGLIDLDLAINFNDAQPPTQAGSLCNKGTGETRTTVGTRAYQAIKLLKDEHDLLGAHDHMDDLESFSYALFHFLAVMDKPVHLNGYLPPLPKIFKRWNSAKTTSCYDAKRQLFADLLDLPFGTWFSVDENSRAVLLAFLRELQSFFAPRIIVVKAATRPREKAPFPDLTLSISDRLKAAEGHYAAFIAVIDRVIVGLERQSKLQEPEDTTASQPEPAASMSTAPQPTPVASTTAQGKKRRLLLCSAGCW